MMHRNQADRFAEKQMRRIMLITMANILCMVCFCQEKSMICLEAGSFIRNRNLSLTFSRAISDKWCIACCGSYRIHEKSVDMEKRGHEDNLGHVQDSVMTAADYGTTERMIAVQFWPRGNYTGAHLTFGISNSEKAGTSFPLSIGYMFRIWTGLRGSIGYRTDVVRTLRYENRSYNHLTIALGYSF